MWHRLTYEISTSTPDGEWEQTIRATDNFRRGPNDVARQLLENWIIDYPHLLNGGERIVVGDEDEPATIVATVRVTLYDGNEEEPETPLAVGYLGHDRRDYTGGIPRE